MGSEPLNEPLEIRYWPGPVADQAHRSKTTVKLIWGALGTAKTTWLCWRVWFMAELAAFHGFSLRAVLMRDTYRNLVDSTLQTWLSWFPDREMGYIAASNPVDFKLFVGGRYHDVLFRHGQNAQDASAFLSTEYDFIGLEEVAPAYIPGGKLTSPGIAEEVFDMALPRLTRKADRAAAINPELAITCNSPPLDHWTSRRIIDKSPEYLQSLNWHHWNFPISDNAANLRPDYYTNLEKAWQGNNILIRRFIRGERVPIFIGIPRFNLDQLDRMRQSAVEPGFRGFLRHTLDNPLHVRLEGNPKGFVKIWKPPAVGKQYVIGADVAEGVEGGDFSSAHVLDREDESICAAWHGRMEPESYADELAKLGYLYNHALIGVESNNHGLTTLTSLKNLNYQRIYYHSSLDARSNRQERIGWPTDTKTKPFLVDGIGAHLDTKPEIPDLELINELSSYGVMENGSCEAQAGTYDDRVMSFGIALVINKRSGLSAIYPSLR
jgi:hypothetical protein